MNRHPLDLFFNPRSVAAIGVSARANKLGYILAENLLEATQTEVYLVNPGTTEILGRRCYPSVAALPVVPELAVIAVPADQVIEALRNCGSQGVKAVLILAAGFSETGTEGARRQEEATRVCRQYGMRALGPNSSGLYNCTIRLGASIAYKNPPGGGSISFFTQSGTSVLVFHEHALDHPTLRFAKLLDYGNQLDVKEYEILDYFGWDPETKVIAAFLEGCADPQRFFEVGRAVSQLKPIVVGKVGRTTAGVRAASAHTGSLPSDSPVFEEGCREAGMIYVKSMFDVLEIAKALDWQPIPTGNRVGIISASGGFAVELADACAEQGLVLPILPPADQRVLRPLMPPFATAQNPVDMGPIYGQFPQIYARCIDVLYDNPEVDSILITIADRGAAHVECLETIGEVVRRRQSEDSSPKPVYVCWSSTRAVLGHQAMLERAGVPCFENSERLARAVATITRYGAFLRAERVGSQHQEF